MNLGKTRAAAASARAVANAARIQALSRAFPPYGWLVSRPLFLNLLKMERQVPRRLEPLARVFFQATTDDPIDARRKIQRRGKGRGIVPQYRGENLDRRASVECRVSSEHLLQRAPEREDVRPVIRWISANLLGRCVAGRAKDRSRSGEGTRLRRKTTVDLWRAGSELGKAKVDQFHLPVAGHKDISRLEVSMKDALLMGGCQAERDLYRVLDGLTRSKRSRVHQLPQGLAIQKLGNDVRGPLVRACVEDGYDVGVVQRAYGLCFPFEANDLFLRVQRLGEDLNGDFASETGITRPVDFPHPTGAEQADNLVRPRRAPAVRAIGGPATYFGPGLRAAGGSSISICMLTIDKSACSAFWSPF